MLQGLTLRARQAALVCVAMLGIVGTSAQAQPGTTNGACCIRPNTATAECIVTSATDCLARQGLFRGPGTTCGPTTCAPTVQTGACCVPVPGTTARTCVITTEAMCVQQQGQWRGAGSVCGNDTCQPVVQTGACCVQSALGVECLQLTQAGCAERQGLWRGPGTQIRARPLRFVGHFLITKPPCNR